MNLGLVIVIFFLNIIIYKNIGIMNIISNITNTEYIITAKVLNAIFIVVLFPFL